MCATLCRLFAVAVLIGLTAAAALTAPVPGAAKGDDPVAAGRKVLDDVADMRYEGRSLNVVVDPRLKDKADAKVTLKLDDVPLETAVRLLAEVAELRAVRMNNVLFVTTPERAEKLRPDADGPVPASPVNPPFLGGPGAPVA